MSLRSCFEALGGNYDAVLSRLPSERLVQKFVLKFLDEGSFRELMAAIQARDGQTAFRAAHTLKGVCLNLSFDRLYASSNELCEALRSGWTEDAPALAEAVETDYRVTDDAIRAYQAELQG